MKIAICISGHSRNYYDIALPNIEADYFISTYNQDGYLPVTPTDRPIAFHAFDHVETNIIDRNKLVNYFNPKMVLVSNDECFEKILLKFGESRTFAGVILKNVALMFYKIKQANDLKREYEELNNFKYDFVFRYRFDTRLDYINFEDSVNSLYIKKKEDLCVYDMVYGGNSSIMDTACDCFSWIMEEPIEHLQKLKDAEHILFQYIKTVLPKIVLDTRFGYTFHSLRDGTYSV